MLSHLEAGMFAGPFCGRRYEKEGETRFRDCLVFYLDGRVRFERYCYGEAAGLVFAAWAEGMDTNGTLLWKEPEFESQRQALPRRLTDVQNYGKALQFDASPQRYLFAEEFRTDKANGYGPLRSFLLRHRR